MKYLHVITYTTANVTDGLGISNSHPAFVTEFDTEIDIAGERWLSSLIISSSSSSSSYLDSTATATGLGVRSR